METASALFSPAWGCNIRLFLSTVGLLAWNFQVIFQLHLAHWKGCIFFNTNAQFCCLKIFFVDFHNSQVIEFLCQFVLSLDEMNDTCQLMCCTPGTSFFQPIAMWQQITAPIHTSATSLLLPRVSFKQRQRVGAPS